MAYDDVLDERIREQLLEIEDDLLDIAIVDQPTLEGFVARLARVTKETTDCLKCGQLSPNTIQLARNVSLTGKLIADKLSNLHRVTTDIAKKREGDIADVFARMSLNDKEESVPVDSSNDRSPSSQQLATAPSGPNNSDIHETPVQPSEKPASYVTNARKWLKKHLHNPYPTYQEKLKILAGTDVPVKTIDNWFTNARRRIGWSALAKRFFRNKRTEVIDCAFRVFVKPNPTLPVDEEIARLFKEMEINVDNFCQDDTDISEAARTLEIVIKAAGKDVSKAESKKVQGVTSKVAKKSAKSRKTSASVRKHSPSPTRNPGIGGPSPKRKIKEKSVLHEREELISNSELPPTKRSRSEFYASTDTSGALSSSGPSTPRSSSSIFPAEQPAIAGYDASPELSVPQSSYNDQSTSVRTTRKRRLSGSEHDIFPPLKRSCEPADAVQCNDSLSLLGPDHSGSPADETAWHDVQALSAPVTVEGSIPDADYCGLDVLTTNDMNFSYSSDWKDLLDAAACNSTSTDGEPGASHVFLDSTLGSTTSTINISDFETSAAERSEGPLAMLHPYDFGSGLTNFPALPDFSLDWSEIPAPSLDPFFLHDEYFTIPVPISQNVMMDDGSNIYSSLWSESSLVETPAFPLALFKESSKPNVANAEAMLSATNYTASCS